MPERHLKVKWPNGSIQDIYSPSSIIDKYFEVGDKLPSSEFLKKSIEALNAASRRVEEVYGYACTSAMHSISQVESAGSAIEKMEEEVEILSIS